MNAHRKRRAAEPAGDYGPRARMDNGTAVLTYRADPDKPHGVDVRGAKGQSYLDRLWTRGALATREWKGGHAYIELAEIAEGGGDSKGVPVVVDGATRNFGPAERALIATTKLRHADARLGTDRNAVRDFLLRDVCGELTLPVLRQALVRLALHFDVPLDKVPQP
jgi:hypothetical protein